MSIRHFFLAGKSDLGQADFTSYARLQYEKQIKSLKNGQGCNDILTGVPNWIQFSNVLTKSESLSLMTWMLLAFSMFLIHLLA